MDICSALTEVLNKLETDTNKDLIKEAKDLLPLAKSLPEVIQPSFNSGSVFNSPLFNECTVTLTRVGVPIGSQITLVGYHTNVPSGQDVRISNQSFFTALIEFEAAMQAYLTNNMHIINRGVPAEEPLDIEPDYDEDILI